MNREERLELNSVIIREKILGLCLWFTLTSAYLRRYGIDGL